MVTAQAVFLELGTVVEEIESYFDKKIKTLSETQRNWKPAASIWSVNEICGHLNAYAAFYHAAFRKKITSTKWKTPADNYSSSPLGRSAWGAIKLGNAKNIKRKFNAPKQVNPLLNLKLNEGNQVEVFSSSLLELKELILQATQVNIRKVKVPMLISKVVRLRLGDTLLFVVYHNQRHIQQIKNLMSHKQFPKK